MGIRFLQDGRLELARGGVRLDPEERWLTMEEAKRLAESADHVIHHYYPKAIDITENVKSIAVLVGRVSSPASEAGEVGASRYHATGVEVLVLSEFH